MSAALTVADVARILGCSKLDVIRSCNRGDYAGAYRAAGSGRWMIPASNVTQVNGRTITNPLELLTRATRVLGMSVEAWEAAHRLLDLPDPDARARVDKATTLVSNAISTWNMAAAAYVNAS